MDPRGPAAGGPAAGILAGIDRFLRVPDLVCVLAVDMPKVNAGTVRGLTWAVEGDPDVDGAVLVDDGGQRQTLAAVYRTASLHASRPADREQEHGLAVRRLVPQASGWPRSPSSATRPSTSTAGRTCGTSINKGLAAHNVHGAMGGEPVIASAG